MKNANSLIVLSVFGLLAVLGCGPDAKRDNPLDPVNGRGVWGTIAMLRGGGMVSGAVITARPVNINTTSDAQGLYSLDLEGGQRYVLTVYHPQFHDTSDTIYVPIDGKLFKKFMISGKPAIAMAEVNTEVIMHEGGLKEHFLHLECLGVHPEGQSYLEEYSFYAVVNNNNYPAKINAVDSFTWDLNLATIYGTIPSPETLIVKEPVTFIIEPGDGLVSVQATVREFLLVPTNLSPNNSASINLPDTLRWTNAQAGLADITVEIWQGTQKKWSVTTADVSSLYCPSTLPAGGYTWLVRTTDINGNTAASEATFIIP
ncbi:MAG: hypothetical protein Q7U87_04680 [bacterium]|nr:hypothetical protein [bacterium]